ncbi:hypothetical protein BDN70DRAFT_875699, partial [Pholiota conissans]
MLVNSVGYAQFLRSRFCLNAKRTRWLRMWGIESQIREVHTQALLRVWYKRLPLFATIKFTLTRLAARI